MTLLVLLSQTQAGATADVSWVQLLPDSSDAVGLAAETDAAFTLDPQGAVGLAVETDAAIALTASADTNAEVSWLQLTADQFGDVDLAEEIDTALGSPVSANVAWVQLVEGVAALASETNTALALSPGVGVGVTAKVAWVQVEPYTGALLDERVAGTWSPALFTRWRLLDATVGYVANDRSTALPLTGYQTTDLGMAVETDVAIALTGTNQAVGSPGVSIETDTPFRLECTVIADLGLALEINVAFVADNVNYGDIGLAQEFDSSIYNTDQGQLRADEVDEAFALASSNSYYWTPAAIAAGAWTPALHSSSIWLKH